MTESPSSASLPLPELTNSSSGKLTPMMEQYIEIKAAYPDALLFYRMGEFYEMFFQDAEEAAKALKITLTKRGKHLDKDIPMCGVPVHNYDEYLQRLIALGYRVAICEQVEDPKEAKKRGAKSVVKRCVVRLVTPATLTEEKLLDPCASNYLMALGYEEKTQSHALAWIDISTGAFGVCTTQMGRLLTDIMRFDPKEVLISDAINHNINYKNLLQSLGRLAVIQPHIYFASDLAKKRIMAYYNVASLDGFAQFTPAELSAISAAIAYVEKTQIKGRPPLMRPKSENQGETVFIDAATRINLEFLSTLSGQKEGSLFRALNRTITGNGARLLAERLMAPLTSPYKINERLDSISFFIKNPKICDALRLVLRNSPDMPRALSRLALGRAGPRDLRDIQKGLETISDICSIFQNILLPQELSDGLEKLKKIPPEIEMKLEKALADVLPILKRDGGFIRENYHSELDELRMLRDKSRAIINSMQQRYSDETQIKNLKIKYNNILGYFIEVTAIQAETLKKNSSIKTDFIHRQTMANAMRFTTAELGEIETKILNAAERVLTIELDIFDSLAQEIVAMAPFIHEGSAILALYDVSASLAILAQEQGYCRPIVDESLAFVIEKGRHPVVEQALRKQAEKPFIANDCSLSLPLQDASPQENKKGALWLLTGPNMGGKSTFLRQNALIAIMAQIGSFVPAAQAHIGTIDRLFSRVGASDDLARGRSTFMVEMIETATILNQATERSLVILDEIGRGTATFDGLSIAWASVEHIHNINQCRTIFATHFHELTVLEKQLKNLQNVTIKVKEWENEVIFLHEVTYGVANRSYGIQVAKLAGLPLNVITRAENVLEKLEKKAKKEQNTVLENAHTLNDTSNKSSSNSEENLKATKLYQKIKAIQPDELTPKQALEQLYALKALEKELSHC